MSHDTIFQFPHHAWSSRKYVVLGVIISTALLFSSACRALDTAHTDSDKERLEAFFEKSFNTRVKHYPMFAAYLGLKENSGKWNDLSEKHRQWELRNIQEELDFLHAEFDFEQLDRESQLNYRLFEKYSESRNRQLKWHTHDFLTDHMSGWQSKVPAFLIGIHAVADIADAKAYIERLRGIRELFNQIISNIRSHAAVGVVPPRFTFDIAIGDAQNVISGKPFQENGQDSPLYADFKNKIEKIGLSGSIKSILLSEAETALLNFVQPAYQDMISALSELSRKSSGNNGAWSLPDGKAYYKEKLFEHTTTRLSAAQIHDIGLADVARIHQEMRKVREQIGFEGSLQEFFHFMRNDKQFYLPNTDNGRQEYMKRTQGFIQDMNGSLHTVFATLPKADVVVRPVEKFREKSVAIAFYEDPSIDGNRPGVYYINLYDMNRLPLFEVEALAYHEAVPGHHMQIAIAQELRSVPKFRRFSFYTAYSEGWGLYAEALPKEMGYYKEPYSDFGRLSMELLRAVRLVVDTGLHYKRWSREKAIEYMDDNTPNTHDYNMKAIERYMVWPGQATAYKIGMMKIQELREKSRSELTEQFDIREFHDVILTNGAVPLEILEQLVDSWIASKKVGAEAVSN